MRFKRLAVQWELRRIPIAASAKEQTFKGAIVITYTALFQDPLYPETIMSQRRATLNLVDLPANIAGVFAENIRLIETVIRNASIGKSQHVISVSYVSAGVDEAKTGDFSIGTKDGADYDNASVKPDDAIKIRESLSRSDNFFYEYALQKVRDENTRLGIKFEGL